MCKYSVGLIWLIVLSSCNSDCTKNVANITGRYFKNENPFTTQYIQLSDNNTYIHYFKTYNIESSHIGTWSIYEDCQILLRDWKFLDSTIRKPLCKCTDYNAFYNKNFKGSSAISLLVDEGEDYIKKK